MRIQIMGYSGSGKSTLAIKLANHFGLKCLHLDNVQFYGDWQERDKQEQQNIVKRFLDEHEDWVIDGNYLDIAPERFSLSDITIFLGYNRFYCYRMCLARYHKNRGQARLSCPCIEKFDSEFRQWLLIKGRTKARRIKLFERFNQCPGTKYYFKNVRELRKFLLSLEIK